MKLEGFTLSYSYWTLVFPAVTICGLILFLLYYLKSIRPRLGTIEWITEEVKTRPFHLPARRHPLVLRDLIPMFIITVIYAVAAFYVLGNNYAPQSFCKFTENRDSVTIKLEKETKIATLMYYTGLGTGHYTLEFSNDGETWIDQVTFSNEGFAMDQTYANLFKWQNASLNRVSDAVSYIRITASDYPMELGEIAIKDIYGNLVPQSEISTDGPELFDEQYVVPSYSTWMNSMYFDEIYHGRTAYEVINNIFPYEITHPPLGKDIMVIGIKLFGMTPFGWRFMGTLFGILMLPLLYAFLKNIFGKTVIASCGTILFAFDFMHYVQTRIATIDTYGVFFIILMYWFMYRYITLDYETPFKKTLPALALSGLFFGIGCACKWTAVYAGAGLFILYFVNLILRGRYYVKDQRGREFKNFTIKTLLFTVLFFIAVPVVIYCLSYIPYGTASGMTIQGGMLWDPKYYDIIWQNQIYMYNYHSTLVATHAYSATWYQWLVDARPILYYLDMSQGNDYRGAFASFGNPIIWWGGLLAIFVMIYRVFRYRDGKAFFIAVGYLSQLIPWLFVTRITFIYHYFDSTVFLVLALTYMLSTIWERKQGRYKLAVFGFTGSAVALFIMFFPVLTGILVSRAYELHFLRWIPESWPF